MLPESSRQIGAFKTLGKRGMEAVLGKGKKASDRSSARRNWKKSRILCPEPRKSADTLDGEIEALRG
jgi:hypothetical protein